MPLWLDAFAVQLCCMSNFYHLICLCGVRNCIYQLSAIFAESFLRWRLLQLEVQRYAPFCGVRKACRDYVLNIVALEWPIRKVFDWLIFIRTWLIEFVFEYSKNRSIRMHPISNNQKIAFFECIQVRMFRKIAFFEYTRSRIHEICEHSKPFQYSKNFREHNYTVMTI